MIESSDKFADGLPPEVNGDERHAFDEHFALVYHELRRLAEQQRHRWEGEHSLNTTALVHEAYLKLGQQPGAVWRDRPHFMAIAAKAMRQILIDYARRQHATKRGAGQHHIPLDEIEAALKSGGDPADAGADALVALDDALKRLGEFDPRQAEIVECRFFGGMAIHETADALGVSSATVKRGWAIAQAWLHRELSRALGDSA
ncbi:MAG: ECF-type sigma factor [Gemmatimonadaceae bacterium]